MKKLFSFFWDKSLLFFVIVGAVNTAISTVGSWLLISYAGWSQFWAMALMFAVCSVASFYFNRKYSFKSKEPLGSSAVRFAVVVTVCFLLSFGLNNLAMPWMREVLFPAMSEPVYNLIKVLGVQVVFTLLNYLGQRLWAFKQPAKVQAEDASTGGSDLV